jgi:hypothetical protein
MTSSSQTKDNKSEESMILLFAEMFSPMGIMADVLKPKAKQFCLDKNLSYKDMVSRSSLWYKGLSPTDQSHARLRHVFTSERTKCVQTGIPFRWSDQQGYSIHTGSVCLSCVETFDFSDICFFCE